MGTASLLRLRPCAAVELEGKDIWVGGNTVTCIEGKINV
jgi:hypothetical protein